MTLELEGIDVVSFDVFDTLLIREHAVSPKDIFVATAHRFGMVGNEVNRFLEHRVLAENHARRRALRVGYRDVTLQDIYDSLRLLHPKYQVEELLIEEFHEELDQLKECSEGKRLFEEAIAQEKRVIAISDTYFSANQVSRMLRSAGLDPHEVYSSADLRQTKSEGQLFVDVLDCEKVDPGKVLHVGDNPLSDTARAVEAGCRVHPFSPRRVRVRKTLRIPNEPCGNIGLAEMLRDFVDAADVADPIPSDGETLERLGRDCLAPLFFSFASWLRHTAIDLELDVLYFAARDGWIVKEVFDAMQSRSPIPTEARYLNVSRASLGPLSFGSLPELWHEMYASVWRDATVAEALDRVGLKWHEVSDTATALGIVTLEEQVTEVAEEFAELVRISRDDSAKHWLDSAKPVEGYLLQEGLFDPEIRAGFVDLGWGCSLQRIIDAARIDRGLTGVEGLYLATSRRAPEECETSYRSFLAHRSKPGVAWDQVAISPSLIELLHGAPHGTTVGYEFESGEFVPSLREDPKEQSGYVQIVEPAQQAALQRVREILDGSNPWDVGRVNPRIVAPLGLRFLSKPSPSEARLLSKLSIASDFLMPSRPLNHSSVFDAAAGPTEKDTLWGPGAALMRNS